MVAEYVATILCVLFAARQELLADRLLGWWLLVGRSSIETMKNAAIGDCRRNCVALEPMTWQGGLASIHSRKEKVHG